MDIKELKRYLDSAVFVDDGDLDKELHKTLDVYLERCIPKLMYSPNYGYGYVYGTCPNCRKRSTIKASSPYCSCGQAILISVD